MTVLATALGTALFVGTLAVASTWFVRWYQQRRAAELATDASRLGLRFAARIAQPWDADVQHLGFRTLDRKVSTISNVFAGTIGEVTLKAFDFSYHGEGIGNDDNYYLACAVAVLPAPAPHFSLERESPATRALRVVGVRDVELEDPEFDDAFKVTCEDPGRLSQFLRPEIRRWLIERAPRDVRFEMRGWTVLASRHRPADVKALLEVVRAIAQLVPPRPTTEAEDAAAAHERALVESLIPAPQSPLGGQLLTAFVVGAVCGVLFALVGALAQLFPL